MQPKLMIPPPKTRTRRPRKPMAAVPAPPPPAAPVLVAVAYDVGAAVWLTLTFDVAVEADGLVVAALVVNEAVRGVSFRGTGAATQPTQESVRVQLIGFAPPSGPGVTLSVPGDAGIVALAGGAAWAGASGLAIPFG